MYALLFTVFGIACALLSGQACFFCEPNEITLSDVYCYPYKQVFLIQAEVIAETGPFLDPNVLDEVTEKEKEQKMAEYGYMRYTMAVKEIYRDDGANIQQTIVIKAYTNITLCGARLTLGKNYVISGRFPTLTLETWACEYIHEYDTEVDVVLPECPGQYKRAIGRRSSPYVNIKKAKDATNRSSDLRPCLQHN